MMQRRQVLIGAAALVAGCSSTSDPGKDSARRRGIDTHVDNALGDLFTSARGTRSLANAAQAVLVFPQVVTAGFVVGGSYGDGALRKGNTTLGYFSLASASVGLLAGAQERTLYLFFMTADALDRFESSKGWTVGGDASVVVVDAGAMARLDKSDSPAVLAMVRHQQGFMASLSLDGTKVTRLKL